MVFGISASRRDTAPAAEAAAGPDPRDAEIARLKGEIDQIRDTIGLVESDLVKLIAEVAASADHVHDGTAAATRALAAIR